MARAHPVVAALGKIGKQIAKAAPEKRHSSVHQAFVIAALAGDRERARTFAEALARGAPGMPPAKKVITALSTHALDVWCHAAGLGDLTGGKPNHDYALVKEGRLEERVKAIEIGVRERVTMNAYAGDYPKDDSWRDRPKGDPWRFNDRWRRVQWLAKPENATKESELDALGRLREILGEWGPTSRGAGYGNELVLAIDLALRHGANDDASRWIEAHGSRLREAILGDVALCFPAIAAEAVRGGLQLAVGVGEKELAAAFAPIEAALADGGAAAKSAAKTAKVPAVQKRTVSCEYSQVHLEHAERSADENDQVYFQLDGDTERGMSLFPTMVGIGTPTDTEDVRASVRIEPTKKHSKADLEGAVQAVAFPLEVRGPLVLRSATSGDDDDDPLIVPPGRYDVLAVFTNERKLKGSPLRKFDLSLSFRAEGSLGAPKTITMEEG